MADCAGPALGAVCWLVALRTGRALGAVRWSGCHPTARVPDAARSADRALDVVRPALGAVRSQVAVRTDPVPDAANWSEFHRTALVLDVVSLWGSHPTDPVLDVANWRGAHRTDPVSGAANRSGFHPADREVVARGAGQAAPAAVAALVPAGLPDIAVGLDVALVQAVAVDPAVAVAVPAACADLATAVAGPMAYSHVGCAAGAPRADRARARTRPLPPEVVIVPTARRARAGPVVDRRGEAGAAMRHRRSSRLQCRAGRPHPLGHAQRRAIVGHRALPRRAGQAVSVGPASDVMADPLTVPPGTALHPHRTRADAGTPRLSSTLPLWFAGRPNLVAVAGLRVSNFAVSSARGAGRRSTMPHCASCCSCCSMTRFLARRYRLTRRRVFGSNPSSAGSGCPRNRRHRRRPASRNSSTPAHAVIIAKT